MRIQPVSFLNQPSVYLNKTTDKRQAVPALGQDSVSFTGPMGVTGKEFKKLSKYMTCLYSGEQMLASSTLEKMKTRGLFKGPVNEVVKKLEPYKKKYLTGIEKNVFECLETFAQTNPKATLTQAFNEMADDIIPALRKRQRPILDAIKTEGAKLPQEYLEPFYKFMEITDRKIYDLPVSQKFSLKEFLYQATKFTLKVSDTNLRNRLINTLKILNDEGFHNAATPLSEKTVKHVFKFVNIKTPMKKSVYYEKNLKRYETDKVEVLKKVIEDMRDVADVTGFKKFQRLCENNLLMLGNKPVSVKFSNKAFKYDLNKLLEDMPDEALKEKMLSIASKLPTSSKNAEAFILKCRDLDPNDIGQKMFDSSLVSIEHLKPQSLGGSDLMENCALAKKSINSERQSEPLWITLTRFKQKNQQKYVNNLAKLVNKKLVPYEDALAQVQTIEREGRIVLNKNNLVKPEMSFMEELKAQYRAKWKKSK